MHLDFHEFFSGPSGAKVYNALEVVFRSYTKKMNPCFLSEVIFSWNQFISGARSLAELSALVISSVVSLNTTEASCMKLSVFTSVLDFFLLQIIHNSCVFFFAEILILRLLYDMPSTPGFPETARDLLVVEATDTIRGLPVVNPLALRRIVC